GSLVALLVRDRERGGVLADLGVGVDRVLLGAVRPVPEVPLERERAAGLLLDGGRELHLQRRGAFVRLGFRDDVELVLLFLRRGSDGGRRRRGLRDGRRRRRGRRARRLLGTAATGRQSDEARGHAGTKERAAHQFPPSSGVGRRKREGIDAQHAPSCRQSYLTLR